MTPKHIPPWLRGMYGLPPERGWLPVCAAAAVEQKKLS